MSEDSIFSDPSPPRRRAHDVPDLPDSILSAYSRLWQLENWLRHMVYVELRALHGDNWQSEVTLEKTDFPKKVDKSLSHMGTPEEFPLSYAQLSELRRIISKNRKLFDPFLPPEKIWDARMDEVSQVRHRVAHFRSTNRHDLDRVMNLLRDIDEGFWKFCTSFNDRHPVLPQTNDPVVKHFLPFDLLPWVEIEKGKWAQVGPISKDEWFGVTVDVTVQPWAEREGPVAGRAGNFYDVRVFLRGSRRRYFDYQNFLENTWKLHKHFVYICLGRHADDIRLVIPAVLGEKLIIQVVSSMIEATQSSASPGEWPSYIGTIKDIVNGWPEYILDPDHALAFITSDMKCSIFGTS